VLGCTIIYIYLVVGNTGGEPSPENHIFNTLKKFSKCNVTKLKCLSTKLRKEYREAEVNLHLFSVLALHGNEQLASLSGSFESRKRAHVKVLKRVTLQVRRTLGFHKRGSFWGGWGGVTNSKFYRKFLCV